MMPSATYASGLSFLIGATLLVGLSVGCDDAPCEDTLTCDVGDSASTSSGTGGASSSSSSQTTSSTGGGGDTGVDTTPPTVLSVTPSVDATGVSNTATILVSFSEPMNRVATQNAFQSSTLTGLTFAWPDDQTMEVTPGNLTYAQGSHDVVANEYSYTITTLAADLAGNQLEDYGTWSFSTLRRVTGAIAGSEGAYSTSASASCFSLPMLRVGRVEGGGTCHAFMTFDLSPIPSGATISSATLTCSYVSQVGANVTSGSLDRITYDSNDPTLSWSDPALESYPNPFSFGQPTPTNPITLDVATSVATVLASNNPTSLQFRMRVTPSAQVQASYLNWRDIATTTGGCRDGLVVSYLAP